MKRMRTMIVAVVCVALVVGTASHAGVRVVVRPWFPLPVVVAPRPPPRYVPAPHPAPAPVLYTAPVGHLDLDIVPGDASVYVDGTYRGPAGGFSRYPNAMALPVGPHDVELRRKGYRTEKFRVNILTERLCELDIRLRPLVQHTAEAEQKPTYKLELDDTGRLVFDVTPADASLYVNGAFYGSVAEFTEKAGAVVLRSGTHRLELVRPGYASHARDVVVEKGITRVVNLEMAKAESNP